MRRRKPSRIVGNLRGKPPLDDNKIIFGVCIKCGMKVGNSVKQWRGIGPMSAFKCAKCKKAKKKEKEERLKKEKEEIKFRVKYGKYVEEEE